MSPKPVQTPLRLLLADDHPVARSGAADRLSDIPDFEVIAQAADAAETLRLAQVAQPDVILLDARMPGLTPAEMVRRLQEVCPKGRVLVLSAYRERALVLGMLKAGAIGYLLKSEELETIAAAIRGAARGETWFSPPIAALVAQEAVGDQKTPSLTTREREVLPLLAGGRTNIEIGAALGISERTARYHLRNIYNKLGVKSRGEAIVLALREGLVEEA